MCIRDSGCIAVMNLPRAVYDTHTEPMRAHINLGTGDDLSIAELADHIREVVGYRGRIEFDTSQPDGAPRKLLEVSRAASIGWRATMPLTDGLRRTYADYSRAVRPVETLAPA